MSLSQALCISAGNGVQYQARRKKALRKIPHGTKNPQPPEEVDVRYTPSKIETWVVAQDSLRLQPFDWTSGVSTPLCPGLN